MSNIHYLTGSYVQSYIGLSFKLVFFQLSSGIKRVGPHILWLQNTIPCSVAVIHRQNVSFDSWFRFSLHSLCSHVRSCHHCSGSLAAETLPSWQMCCVTMTEGYHMLSHQNDIILSFYSFCLCVCLKMWLKYVLEKYTHQVNVGCLRFQYTIYKTNELCITFWPYQWHFWTKRSWNVLWCVLRTNTKKQQ